MANLELRIDNMHCGACVRRVTQTVNGLPATHAQSVAVGAAQVTTEASADTLLNALKAAGFPATITGQSE